MTIGYFPKLIVQFNVSAGVDGADRLLHYFLAAHKLKMDLH